LTDLDRVEVDALRAARDRVMARIADACARVGRRPGDVELVAVSKTVPPERLRAAVEAGLTRLGENRVQEAEAKVGQVAGATWELVGSLQSNKARRALTTFARIESVDSLDLARRLDRLAGDVSPGVRYPVLLEVNVDRDPAKSGFAPDALAGVVGDLDPLTNLEVQGLMTIGRLAASADDARRTFAALRDLSARLRTGRRSLGAALSMGMTDDFEAAVEEGATIVRVGRAIFGERPHSHDDGSSHVHAVGPHGH
jgi:pyridoxal phosphate enzyme (YggS family)